MNISCEIKVLLSKSTLCLEPFIDQIFSWSHPKLLGQATPNSSMAGSDLVCTNVAAAAALSGGRLNPFKKTEPVPTALNLDQAWLIFYTCVHCVEL